MSSEENLRHCHRKARSLQQMTLGHGRELCCHGCQNGAIGAVTIVSLHRELLVASSKRRPPPGGILGGNNVLGERTPGLSKVSWACAGEPFACRNVRVITQCPGHRPLETCTFKRAPTLENIIQIMAVLSYQWQVGGLSNPCTSCAEERQQCRLHLTYFKTLFFN